MRLYLVQPANRPDASQTERAAHQATCVEPIADLILQHLLADPAMFAMRHHKEVSSAPIATTDRYGYAEVVRLHDRASLRSALVASGDPFSGQWMLIRSLVTCRAVFYGYDGQAFVCLPHEAGTIISPDTDLIDVDECSEDLITTDWLDGLRSD